MASESADEKCPHGFPPNYPDCCYPSAAGLSAESEARRLAGEQADKLVDSFRWHHHDCACDIYESCRENLSREIAAALNAAREAERERWAKKLDAEVARIRGLFREYKSTEISDAIVSHLDSWARRLRENKEPAE